jgi:hypothetical protein
MSDVVRIVTEEDLDKSLKVDGGTVFVNIDNDTIIKDVNGVLSSVSKQSVIRGILAESTPSGSLVYFNGSSYNKFNASNVSLYDRLVGMTNQSGASGAIVDIITEGVCNQVSGLSPNTVYYAGNNGVISTSPPIVGLRISVGSALTSDKFNVKIKDSIIRI